LDRRVFFHRRISNDSLIVDLVSATLSSDGPAAVLARRPREQPAAVTKRVRAGEEAPFGIVVYSEPRHIIMPVSFVAYTRPPCFPRRSPPTDIVQLARASAMAPDVHLLGRLVDASSREGKFIRASPGWYNSRERMNVLGSKFQELLPLIDFRVKRQSWPHPVSRRIIRTGRESSANLVAGYWINRINFCRSSLMITGLRGNGFLILFSYQFWGSSTPS